MANLTTTQVLDDALLNIQDSSTTMRARFLNWLNNAIQDLAIERDWLCMQTSVEITLVNNQLAKPTDFGRVVSLSSPTLPAWYVTTQNKLSFTEFASMQNRTVSDAILWTEGVDNIIFLNAPAVSSVILTYIPQFTAYAEGATIPFPATFSNYFQRAILTTYYEFDMDERAAMSNNILKSNLKSLKHMENQLVNARAGWSKDLGLVNTDAR